MTVRRLLAILFIFASTAVAWFILGASVATRTSHSKVEGGQQVALLWGGQHSQAAPTVTHNRFREVSEVVTTQDESGGETTKLVKRQESYCVQLDVESSSVEVDLTADHRRKGLLWFDAYTIDYRAVHRLKIPDKPAQSVTVEFRFPSQSAIYDDFSLRFNGEEGAEVASLADGVSARFDSQPGQVATIDIHYRSRGFDTWSYRFGGTADGRVRNLDLVVTTDFGGIDFPPGALSPNRNEPNPAGRGRRLAWRFDNMLSGQHIGIDIPNRLNPGPLTARIIFFAPVSLLFFITVLVMLGALGHLELHPMHFFFLSAAFFSFHLLMAYLADHVNIHVAFVTAAAVSLALVSSYLRLICGLRKALRTAGAAQLIFLVLFSYAFFFEGLTGLAVTIGSIVTLFVLMQLTARVDWNGVFVAGRGREAAARASSP